MELESHYNDYIESYISYLSMMHTIYSIFTQGITYFFLVSAINTIWSMITDIYVIKSWYCFIYRLRRFCILLSLQCYLFCIMLLFMLPYLVIYCPFDPLVAELNFRNNINDCIGKMLFTLITKNDNLCTSNFSIPLLQSISTYSFT